VDPNLALERTEALAGRPPLEVAVAWLRRLLLPLLALAVLLSASVHAWDPERIVRAAQRYGPGTVAAARQLQQAMAAVVGKDVHLQLQAVNDFYNQHIAYREDIDLWGQVDYWASPLESLDKGAGDCEDYAIAKYMTLVALGMPHANLRMVYVRASLPAGGAVVPHMVLAWYASPDAEPLVLDNLATEIRRASERPDLSPVFSFNADGLWQGVGGIRANGDPQTRLSRWRDVLQKSRQDGFQ